MSMVNLCSRREIRKGAIATPPYKTRALQAVDSYTHRLDLHYIVEPALMNPQVYAEYDETMRQTHDPADCSTSDLQLLCEEVT